MHKRTPPPTPQKTKNKKTLYGVRIKWPVGEGIVMGLSLQKPIFSVEIKRSPAMGPAVVDK